MDEKTFLQEVAERLRCDGQRAEAVTFTVFQELRDRLTPHEAGDVAAQLPKGLRRLWQEGDRPDRKVRRTREAEFIGRVRLHAALPDEGEARRAVRAVFAVLQRLLGSRGGVEGEAWDVFSQLPKDLKKLWLTAGDTES
jgi:uncharacterized protein (DUF2267 family)